MDFAGNLQIALHDDFVGELESKQKKEKQGGEELVVGFLTGKKKQGERDEEKNAARGGKLVQKRPEKLADNGPRPLPAGELADFAPLDVLAVEAVGGARVGGKLGPKIFDGAAFADTLPEVLDALDGSGTRKLRGGGRGGGSAHEFPV